MKKAVLILAVLVLFSTLAFATPNFGLGIWGRTQFTLAQGSTDPAKPQIFQGWSEGIGNSWNWDPDYEQQFWYTGDVADFNLGWQINPQNDTFPFRPTIAFATLRIVPDLLTLRFGLSTMNGLDTYRRADVTDDQNGNTGRMGGQGFWLTVEPKDSNFSATVFYQTPKFAVGEVRNIMEDAQLTEFCAAYTVPNIVKITAGTQTVGKTAVGAYFTYDPNNNYQNTALIRSIFGRADVLAVSGLSAFLDVSYDGLEKAADNNVPNADLSVMLDVYYNAIENVSLWVVPRFAMMMKKADSASSTDSSYGVNMGMDVKGWNVRFGGSYTIGDYTPALSVTVAQPNLDISTMAIGISPSVHFNKFNAQLGANVNLSTASGSFITWNVVAYVDSSFW